MEPINYGNLFSGEYDDRVDDVYYELVNRLDKSTLESYCKTSTELNKFCNSDYWLTRINNDKLTPLLPFRSFYSSLASFYKFVRQDACYIVTRGTWVTNNGQKQKAFTDIRLAYNSILKSIALDAGKDVNMLTDTDIITNMNIEEHKIVVMFNGVKLQESEQDRYAIWTNLEGEKNYNNPNILSFPTLAARDIVVVRYFDEGIPKGGYTYITKMIQLLAFDNKSANLLPRDRIRLLPVNYDGKYLFLDLLGIIKGKPVYYNTQNMYHLYTVNLSDDPQYVNYKIVAGARLNPDWVRYHLKHDSTSEFVTTLTSAGAILFESSELRSVITKYVG